MQQLSAPAWRGHRILPSRFRIGRWHGFLPATFQSGPAGSDASSPAGPCKWVTPMNKQSRCQLRKRARTWVTRRTHRRSLVNFQSLEPNGAFGLAARAGERGAERTDQKAEWSGGFGNSAREPQRGSQVLRVWRQPVRRRPSEGG